MLATLIKIAVFAFAGYVMFRLTEPVRFRSTRWIRIVFSWFLLFPIVNLFGSSLQLGLGLGSIASIVILCFVWRPVISDHVGGKLVDVMFAASDTKGFQTDYKAARSALKDADYELALELTQRELSKDEKNYEGRLLMTQIYYDLKKPEFALVQLEIICRNPQVMPAQIEVVQATREQVIQLQKHLQAVKSVAT